MTGGREALPPQLRGIKHLMPPPVGAPLSPGRRFSLWMKTLWLDHSFFRFWFNTRSRVGDGLFRSSHPMPYQLRAAARAGVRSVLNLRGVEPHIGSNQLEWDVCRQLNLPVFHYPLGSRSPPERQHLLDLIQLFDRLPAPILIHCKSGADRAGLVSALYLLVNQKRPLDQALKQLSLRFGHIRQARTGVLDHVFEVYRADHARTGIGFQDWASTVYDRDKVAASFRSQGWANRLVDGILRRE
jgi:protein tyrosine phosphatase (PTP) superfamily phosphohydrolase (DUF442 family)